MVPLFLRAKHWQLFLLMLGIPMLFQITTMLSLFGNMEEGGDSLIMMEYIKLFPIIMLLFIGVLFGWFWSIVTGLQSKIPEEVEMNVKGFRITFFAPLAYIIFFLGFFFYAFQGGDFNPNMIILIIPLHLFSIGCMIYNLYFVAKTIKTVELQREVSFGDFAGEFVLIWMYPIGIWIIQPKINRMTKY